MSFRILYIIILFISIPLISYSQQITNVYFEQVGKQIHIYYDLTGDQNYTVQVFCSADNAKTWGNALQKLTGAAGDDQSPGFNKKISWDVLAERDKLSGEILFKLVAGVEITGTFSDIRDDQIYKWVKIGEQVWMADNLNYNTGEIHWCYDDNKANCDKFGGLYKWNEINQNLGQNAVHGICPEGWHIPTDGEWKILIDYLGGSDVAGGKLKEAGFKHWNSPNTGNTNESGFSALPGGFRMNTNNFYHLGGYAYFWSSTQINTHNAWIQTLNYNSDEVYRRSFNKEYGFSVRCIMDY